MKLAIIGPGPIALEAALRFHTHGASLTWFYGGEEDLYQSFQSASFSSQEFISPIGLGLLQEAGKTYRPEKFSWQEWRTNYQEPLKKILSTHQKVRKEEVISVSKRFLGANENIPGKSRFYDLFRVIFLVDPKQFIEEQKDIDPDKFQKLTSELVGSLQTTIEMFEDFDLVIDARRATEPSSIAQSGRALGEKRMGPGKVLSGPELLKDISFGSDIREVALVGSQAFAAEILLKMSEWLKDERNKLFIVSHEEEPFAHFMHEARSEVTGRLKDLLHDVEVRLQKDYANFHHKLREWQELDDFIRVKKPKPVEPIPQVNFFSGHNATAIDELIDRRRLFLTLERPEFREGKIHPENNRVELKTIGVDRVLNGMPLRKKTIKTDLQGHEPGYFELSPGEPTLKAAWEKDLIVLKGIEDEIFKFFSPADHH